MLGELFLLDAGVPNVCLSTLTGVILSLSTGFSTGLLSSAFTTEDFSVVFSTRLFLSILFSFGPSGDKSNICPLLMAGFSGIAPAAEFFSDTFLPPDDAELFIILQ